MKKLFAAALLLASSAASAATITYNFGFAFNDYEGNGPFRGQTGQGVIVVDTADITSFGPTIGQPDYREYNFRTASITFDIGATHIATNDFWHVFANDRATHSIQQYGYLGSGNYYTLNVDTDAPLHTFDLVESGEFTEENFQGGSVNFLGSTGVISSFAVSIAPVPEPGEWAMMLGGLAIVGGMARRRLKIEQLDDGV